jgi:ribokinase
MTSYDAVGFGALNVDKLFKVNRIAMTDEEGVVTGFEESCGGSAANTMVGLARLGCKVGFVGKVADDPEGRMLIGDFRKENVDTKGVVVERSGRSGKVMGFIDEKGDRALYVDSGVNDKMDSDDIDTDYVARTSFLHLTSFVGEKSFQSQKKTLESLPKNVKISLDPGEIYARKGLEALEPILKKAFALMPKARELQILTGRPDYKENAEFMLGKGVKIVAVKLGSNGCFVTDGKESYRVESFKVKAVDTTGAGDAFCAGFLYGLINDKDLYESGRIGNFVASRCVMKMGARTGLPRLAELEQCKLV